MNQADRRLMERLYRVLDVPKPSFGAGTQSATMMGFIGYAKDMMTVAPHVREVLLAMAAGDRWEEVALWPAEEGIARLERWYELRRAEQWKSSQVTVYSIADPRLDAPGPAAQEDPP